MENLLEVHRKKNLFFFRFFDFAALLGLIVEWKSQPRSLMHSCRTVIRRSLVAGGRHGLPDRAIAALPIASSLKRSG